jgi:hypothetical protein
MSLDLKRFSCDSARLKMFIRRDADLHAQYLELMELRERLREAQLWADLQGATKDRKPAPSDRKTRSSGTLCGRVPAPP